MPEGSLIILMKNKILTAIPVLIILTASVICFMLWYKDHQRMNRPYLYCNDHVITKPEYEYFYNSYKQYYISSFSNFFSYMGVDENLELEDQEYENGKTFGQMFEEEVLEQVKETYALCDEAEKEGFEYDSEAKFEEFYSMVEESCRASNISTDTYFRQFYGQDINTKLVRKYMIKGFYAAAYYDLLIENTSYDEAYIYVNELKKGYETRFADD